LHSALSVRNNYPLCVCGSLNIWNEHLIDGCQCGRVFDIWHLTSYVRRCTQEPGSHLFGYLSPRLFLHFSGTVRALPCRGSYRPIYLPVGTAEFVFLSGCYRRSLWKATRNTWHNHENHHQKWNIRWVSCAIILTM
jgi:hypothetical protein